MILTVAGIDPSLRHTGLSRGTFDTESKQLVITDLLLISSEKSKVKTLRVNSDDLQCCQNITAGMMLWLTSCHIAFAEMPTGGQSASASKAFGMCIGMLSSVGLAGNYRGSLVQVQPSEVKKAATGSKNASKDEMISWATAKWPDATGWLRLGGKPTGRLLNDNEHLADACGAIEAGLQTDQFKTLSQMLRSLS